MHLSQEPSEVNEKFLRYWEKLKVLSRAVVEVLGSFVDKRSRSFTQGENADGMKRVISACL